MGFPSEGPAHSQDMYPDSSWLTSSQDGKGSHGVLKALCPHAERQWIFLFIISFSFSIWSSLGETRKLVCSPRIPWITRPHSPPGLQHCWIAPRNRVNSSLPVTAAGLGRECQLPGSCARWFLRTNFTGTLTSGVGFPGGSGGKESACSAGDLGSIPGFGRSPGEGNSHPTQVFWPGEFHGQRSLAGYSPWGHKESDTTEWLSLYWGQGQSYFGPKIYLSNCSPLGTNPSIASSCRKHYTGLPTKFFRFFCNVLWKNPNERMAHMVSPSEFPQISGKKSSVQFNSVAQLCPTLCDPMDCSTPGFPVHHQLPELAQTHVHRVGDAIDVWMRQHLILCCPLLLPSIFPSIRVFSNKWVFHIRWPKYWSFSFSISPSNEYSGFISFRIDWFDLLAAKGPSRVFSSTTAWKHQFFGAQPFLLSSSHIHTWLLEKP